MSSLLLTVHIVYGIGYSEVAVRVESVKVVDKSVIEKRDPGWEDLSFSSVTDDIDIQMVRSLNVM